MRTKILSGLALGVISILICSTFISCDSSKRDLLMTLENRRVEDSIKIDAIMYKIDSLQERLEWVCNKEQKRIDEYTAWANSPQGKYELGKKEEDRREREIKNRRIEQKRKEKLVKARIGNLIWGGVYEDLAKEYGGTPEQWERKLDEKRERIETLRLGKAYWSGAYKELAEFYEGTTEEYWREKLSKNKKQIEQ